MSDKLIDRSTCPKISVVVPTYNQVQYLGACLDSIYFQDYPNLEIVVVDDCSTDGTAELIHEFVQDVKSQEVSFAAYYDDEKDDIVRQIHPRYPQGGRELKIICNNLNMGSTRTYNRGFIESTGTYCTYVASDDLCHPAMLSTLAKVLDTRAVDFVYSDMVIIDDNGRILREFRLPAYSFEESFCKWYLCGVSKLYRRELHHTLGYYNEEFLANDHELYLRFAMNGVRFQHIPKILYSVRSHENREENVHSPGNWSRLLKESCGLVKKARSIKSSVKE
jgi:glycosyltransferase involved in cell wall biosynthesis